MAHRKDQVEMQRTAPPVRPLWPTPPCGPLEPVHDWEEAATEPAAIYTEYVSGLPEGLDGVTACDNSETDGETNWMANLARMLVFTVLLVALLVVSVVLSHSSGWLDDHDVTLEPAVGLQPLSVGLAYPEDRGSTPTEFRMSRGASSRRGGTKTGDYAKLGETASGRGDVMTEVASDVIEEEDVSTAAHVLHNPPRTKSHQCGDPFFSLCPESKQEFYFRASQRACLYANTENVIAVCNRGPNRFSSRESCRDACGGGDSDGDKPECSGRVIFSECRAEDVTGVQWFFDGERCRAWSFHRGLCPGNGSSAFSTRRQCRKACVKPGWRRNLCAVPRAEVCAPDMLKYPFFADMSAARAQDRCMAATPKILLGRQCLEGNNRFASLEDCGRACMERVR